MEYRYETHVHTCESSRCAVSSGVEFARHFASLGYSGIFVTDHFLNGHTAVPADLPWAERIALFCRGYEEAAREGRRLGLDVFFGWEFHCGWPHMLTYGLDREWLLAHPDLLEWDIVRYFDQVHADGGAIVQAHPFQDGMAVIHLMPDKTDAIEVANACRPEITNRRAREFAVSYNLSQTAGSDIHDISQRRLCGVTCSRRLADGCDYVRALKAGETTIFDIIRPDGK
jgi:hypothetical protein